MTAAVIFMVIAAFRAQTTYRHRLDEPLVRAPLVNNAIRLGLAGLLCLIAEKVLA